MDLSMQDIKYLPGVGPKKATLFATELGIRSVEDLLRHFRTNMWIVAGFITYTK